MPGTPQPEVSILIVSYNTCEMTLAAIDAVVRETRAPHEIIVVDNNSSDGSAEAIAAHPAQPRLIALRENIGFGRANNVAARSARARHLLLLNPDTVVLYRAVDSLLEFARARPDAKIWGGRTIFGDGSLNAASCWQQITLWNQFCGTSGLAALRRSSALFNPEAYGGWQRNTEREVDIVSGCFLMVEQTMWSELGGFDPTFYMYGEEADFCLRARAKGARPLITPKATIIHHGGASERTRADKMEKLLAAKMSLVSRHVPHWQQPLTRMLLKMWPMTRLIATSIASRLSSSRKLAEDAETWREVWRCRSRWQIGYPTSPFEKTAATRVVEQG